MYIEISKNLKDTDEGLFFKGQPLTVFPAHSPNDRFLNCPYMQTNAIVGNGNPLEANVIRVVPFVLPANTNVMGVAIIPVNGGGLNLTKFRFGIYSADSSTRLPSKLVWQSAEMTLTVYNKAYLLTGFGNVPLRAGIYYFALITDAISGQNGKTTPVTFLGLPTYYTAPIIGFDTGLSMSPVVRLEKVFLFGPNGLPADFPNSPTLQTASSLSVELFLIKTGQLVQV